MVGFFANQDVPRRSFASLVSLDDNEQWKVTSTWKKSKNAWRESEFHRGSNLIGFSSFSVDDGILHFIFLSSLLLLTGGNNKKKTCLMRTPMTNGHASRELPIRAISLR